MCVCVCVCSADSRQIALVDDEHQQHLTAQWPSAQSDPIGTIQSARHVHTELISGPLRRALCVCVGGQTGCTQSTWAVIAASLQKAGSQAVLLVPVILITTSMGNQHNGPTRNCLMKCPDRTM